ncbi:MAG: murein L,D-transpeptidase catalytic domain family protein [Cetobacterium sp.]|uniref:murein L,D-transpeptidase catalytic domain family protein n=1 Tax=Cetobacterium TaxID=180162 RepID=UPI00211EE7F5
MLRKNYLSLFIILGILSTATFASTITNPTSIEKNVNDYSLEKIQKKLYEEIGLAKKVDYKVFQKAITGYSKIENKEKNDYLTIIDFSKPSTEERFFIIDLKQKKLLVSTYVTHGKNSGLNVATSFSNKVNSYKSSIGFFKTENTYMGKNGYSLVLDGLEKGINDNAKKRYIVIHGADYANPQLAKNQGRLGRSLGCPALPKDIYKQAINLIKSGSVVFAYGDDPKYKSTSTLV